MSFIAIAIKLVDYPSRCRIPSLVNIGWYIKVLFIVGYWACINARASGLDNWHWRNPLPQGNPLESVAYGNGIYVAVGIPGTILTSKDGENWTLRDFTEHSWLRGITYATGKFVAVGNGIWTSTDGTSWTKRENGNLYAITYGNGQFVGVGWIGSMLTSTDGITWSNQVSGTTEELNAVIYANGKFVVVGGYYLNGVILTSDDALIWTNRTISTDILNGVTYGNGQFVAVGWKWGGTDVSITSPDGVTWTRHTRLPATHFSDVCFGQGLYIAADYTGLFTSTDGLTWTKRYAEGDQNSLYKVTSVNGRFVSVGNSGAIVTSLNGIDWTRRTLGTSGQLQDIAYGNDTLVAAGWRGLALTSSNGENWVRHDFGTNNNISKFTFAKGIFVGTGRWSNNNVIITSSNGAVWTPQLVATSPAYVYDIAFGGGSFVAVGGVDYGYPGAATIMTSTNGTNWINRLAPTTNAIDGIAFGGGVFVAVGGNGTILTSEDGITWALQNSNATNTLNTVGYGDGKFVTGDSYGSILISSNGVIWTELQINGFNTLWGVGYGNGTFVAVGADGVLTSTNALNWQYRTFPSITALQSVIYAQNTFIVVGDWGTLLQSDYIGPPTISGHHLTPGGFTYSVRGEPGRLYQVQANTNLDASGWSDLNEFTAGETNTTFLDSSSPQSPQRFYRLRQMY